MSYAKQSHTTLEIYFLNRDYLIRNVPEEVRDGLREYFDREYERELCEKNKFDTLVAVERAYKSLERRIKELK